MFALYLAGIFLYFWYIAGILVSQHRFPFYPIFFFHYLFIYFWLCWVFVSVRGLSPVAASGGLSLSRPLLLRSTGSRRACSVIVAHGPSRSVACGILPDQGSNPCPLHWQADSQPLRHQGSPYPIFIFTWSFHWDASSQTERFFLYFHLTKKSSGTF